MSEEDGRTPSQPRPVKDIKGLLKFCMEATRMEDAQNSACPEIYEPMTEDRQKWLEEALSSMSVSPVERMTLCVRAIEEAEIDTEAGTEQQIRALTELQDWGEDIDIAADFIKINGLRIVPKLLSSEVSEIRWRCLELLAVLSQNNPVAQMALLTLKLLPVMLLMLDTDPNPTVRVKALYAISCLVRSNTEAQQQFLAHDGLTVLVKALHSDEQKLRVKATFMISSVCQSNPTFKDVLVAKGVVEQLVQLVKEEDHSSNHEYIMSALLAIVSEHAEAWSRCLKEELDVRTFLCQRIRFLDGKEAFEEEKHHAEQLLKLLNTNPTSHTSSSSSSTSVSSSDRSMALMAA